nr:MAG TPA: hypothetical protein [Caudoviricetes sp.]
MWIFYFVWCMNLPFIHPIEAFMQIAYILHH